MVTKIELIPSVPTLPEKIGRVRRSVQTVILVQPDRTAHLEREYVQLIGAGSVTALLEDHGGMDVHAMACDGIASMAWGICGRESTRPWLEPRDTAMA